MHSETKKHAVTLVTGGSRSGKSSYALKLAAGFTQKVFLATAEPFDKEMRERIVNHQLERNEQFLTVEEPIEIWEAIRTVETKTEVIVLDCLTVWLGNLHYRLDDREKEETCIQELVTKLQNPPCDIIIVTNEVGMGLVPETEMGRRFRDTAGRLNQRVAEIADKVVLVVSGIPLVIKNLTEVNDS